MRIVTASRRIAEPLWVTASFAACSIDRPPDACSVHITAPILAASRTAPATVFGMS
ncbi:MAG: hypothetical protein HW385_1591 [candidate division NC10 bacterium]|nr:hypothetical protein [candidate division NC10 bacterium]